MSFTNFRDYIPYRPGSHYFIIATTTLLIPVFSGSATVAAQPSTDAPLSINSYEISDDIPDVLTTTRLRQPKTKVPGTTSVIQGEMIRDLGIMSLAEIFRLVPGMVVANVGSGRPVTSYHGTVHYEQRRMQVLVDGRTAHRANISDVDWQTLPVPMELIERIEVSRGPNSAAYGINAFLGTINIITRSPSHSSGAEARIVRGSRNYVRTFASVGDTNENYDWRLAYEKRKFDGFDYQLDGDRQAPFHNGHDINVFNYDSSLRINSNIDADIRAGLVDGINEEDALKNGEPQAMESPDIDVRDYYLQTQFNVAPSQNHFFHVQVSFENYNRKQRWPIEIPESTINCLANDIPVYEASNQSQCFQGGGTPLAANINADSEESRLEFELQDTYLFNQNLKLVTGAGYRKDTYHSETYFNGHGNNYQSRVFGNLEYTPIRWLTFNGGGNWERTTTTDNGYFSPRVAANLTINNNHAIRFVYSQAVRTPDEFEQNPDYGFTLNDVKPTQYAAYEGYRINSNAVVRYPDFDTLGKDLDEETIVSREISYFGQFPLERSLLSLEVRVFKDRMRDMISGVMQFRDWTIDNNVDMDQTGFELEAALEYPNTTYRATYGYLDQDSWYSGPEIDTTDASTNKEQKEKNVALLGRLSVMHSGSLAMIREFPAGFKGSTAFYWADEFRHSRFSRLDIRVAKQVFQPRYTAEFAVTLQHYINDEPNISTDNNIRDQNQLFVEAGVRF